MRFFFLLGALPFLAACGRDHAVEEPFDSPPGPKSCVPSGVALQLAVDLSLDEETVYIADRRGSGGAIVQVDKGCASGAVLAEVAEELHAVATADGAVYWVTRTTLWRLDDGDSSPTAIADLGDRDYGDIAFDDTHAYLVLGSSLERVPKHGGTLEPLASFGCAADSVAVDATHAYVAQSGCAGDVVRVDKATTELERISARQFSDSVAVDATDVYWVRYDWGSLTRWPKTGGEAPIIGNTVHSPGKLALDDTRVFYAGKYDIGSYMKGNSEEWWVSVEAMNVAVDGDFVWALDREKLTRVPRPPDDEITGFPTGGASATFEWIINGGQNCPDQAEMALLLLGPTARNITVSCGVYSHTFADLAAGQYVMHVESPTTSIGFASDPFTLTDSSHEVLGPLDMGSL